MVQTSSDPKKWAQVILNIKYKYFKAKMKNKTQISLVFFAHSKDLLLYFEDERKAKMVYLLIKEYKNEIMLKELTYFNMKIRQLKSELDI